MPLCETAAVRISYGAACGRVARSLGSCEQVEGPGAAV